MNYKMILSALLAVFLITGLRAQDQYDSLPPYRKDSTLPNFLLLRQDSSWLSVAQTPKKTAVVITFFNPDCEHCQHEATRLAKSMEKMKKIDFTWSALPVSWQLYILHSKNSHSNK